MERTCSIEGCGKSRLARGWCSAHWTRWQRYGDPLHRVRGEVRDGKRVCPQCREDIPLEEWGKGACRPCVAARMRRRRSNPAIAAAGAAATRRWYWENAERAREAQRLRRRKNYDKAKAYSDARRAMRQAAQVEVVSPSAVFIRDGWRCGLCGMRIDPSKKYPDPMSKSLDHVVPLSKGGQHSMVNLQASHLVCNLRKHVGGKQQLRLI